MPICLIVCLSVEMKCFVFQFFKTFFVQNIYIICMSTVSASSLRSDREINTEVIASNKFRKNFLTIFLLGIIRSSEILRRVSLCRAFPTVAFVWLCLQIPIEFLPSLLKLVYFKSHTQ